MMQPSLPSLPCNTSQRILSNKNLVFSAAAFIFIVLIIIPTTTYRTTITSTTTTAISTNDTDEKEANQQQSAGGSSSSSSQQHELLYRLLISACVTILYEILLGHPLDLLKIHMQTSSQDHEESYRQAIVNIIAKRENGIYALWDGFVPFGMLQSATKGGAFGLAHTMWTKILLHLLGEDCMKSSSMWARTLAGALAGAVQGYFMTPTLLLKTRVITRRTSNTSDDSNNNSDDASSAPSSSGAYSCTQSWRVIWDILRNEGGIAALFKGAHVFALKRFLDWSTRFYFANLVEHFILVAVVAMQHEQQQQSSTTTALLLTAEEEETLTTKLTLSLSQKILASLVGGFLSCCCTTPLDALVARIQDAKRAGSNNNSNRNSVWQVLRQEFFMQKQPPQHHGDYHHDYVKTSTSDDVLDDDENENGSDDGGRDQVVVDDDDPPAAADTANSKRRNGMKSLSVEASVSEKNSSSSYSHASFYRGFQARVLHVSLTTVVLKTVSPWVYDKLCQPK